MKLILNPASKSGKGKKYWALWQEKLNKMQIDFRSNETESLQHAYNLAKDSNENVIAVGGDGTINQVINGLMTAENTKSMGVLYAGTSPDFCRFHNIPIQPEKALRCLLDNKKKMVDVIEILYKDKDKSVSAYFACSCNIGLGADIARFANKWRKVFGDCIGTGLGVIKTILANKTFNSSLTIDNKEYVFARTNHIFIVKNPFIASGLKLNLNIEPDDGRMFVVLIHDLNRLKLLSVLRHLYSGKIVKNDKIFIKECREVSVNTCPIKEIEFDGDPQGFTKMTAKIIPGKLSLICGQNNA
ncbi:MAG: hypothetical protein JEZ07_10700 [Phycisphaerae bacterium]|nr:hypothetical protein [Phycisphaerae bacterium]